MLPHGTKSPAPRGAGEPGIRTEQDFRRLCALCRTVLQADPQLLQDLDEPGGYASLAEALKVACARAGLSYGGDALTRVLAVIVPRKPRRVRVNPQAEAERQALLRRALGPLGWYGGAR